MNTIKEQTQQERRAMYMKLTKQELVELLIANQDVIQHLIKPPLQIPTYIPYPPQPLDPHYANRLIIPPFNVTDKNHDS